MAKLLEPANYGAVGAGAVTRQHLETMSHYDESVMTIADRVTKPDAHFRRRHSANLRRAKSTRAIDDARYRQFGHAMDPFRANLAVVCRDATVTT